MVPDPPTRSCPFCCIIAIGKFCPKSVAYLCSNPEICPTKIPPMPKDVAGTVITKKISIKYNSQSLSLINYLYYISLQRMKKLKLESFVMIWTMKLIPKRTAKRLPSLSTFPGESHLMVLDFFLRVFMLQGMCILIAARIQDAKMLIPPMLLPFALLEVNIYVSPKNYT